MFALRVSTTDSGKTFVQVSASQVFLDYFIHHRAKEPILLFAMFIIAGLEISIVGVQDLPQGRICWLSWVIDGREGSHKSPFAKAGGKLILRARAD
jgi:hypothetical protein